MSDSIKTVTFCPICKEEKIIEELHMEEKSETITLECGHKLKYVYGELRAKEASD